MCVCVWLYSGDLMFKSPEYTKGMKSGITAEPHLQQIVLSETDDFVVLACDGLWDVMTHQDVLSLVGEVLTRTNDPQEAANRLVREALERHSTDNVSAIVFTWKDHQTQ
jgi:serine/threonine protein phosphatase PrpC